MHRSPESPNAGLSQASASVMNGEDSQQPVHRRPAGLTIRVEEIDCVLADIQAQIEMLGRDEDLSGTGAGRIGRSGMEAKWNGSSLCNTSFEVAGQRLDLWEPTEPEALQGERRVEDEPRAA